MPKARRRHADQFWRDVIAAWKKSGQTVASGGARGLDPEVDAKGGPNPAVVSVDVSRGDIDTFRKEGKLA